MRQGSREHLRRGGKFEPGRNQDRSVTRECRGWREGRRSAKRRAWTTARYVIHAGKPRPRERDRVGACSDGRQVDKDTPVLYDDRVARSKLSLRVQPWRPLRICRLLRLQPRRGRWSLRRRRSPGLKLCCTGRGPTSTHPSAATRLLFMHSAQLSGDCLPMHRLGVSDQAVCSRPARNTILGRIHAVDND